MQQELVAATSILAPSLPAPAKQARQVFVAYPYRLYHPTDYRKVYRDLEKPFQMKFVFADEKITTLHILQKIYNYIRESRFAIFDITGWNANVTLEYGLALGLNERAFVLFDPSKTEVSEVPADIRGLDRMHYGSYSELSTKLGDLLGQELPVEITNEAENQVALLRQRATDLVTTSDGLRITDIAAALGISTDLAKVVVRPLVDTNQLRLEGIKRGARHHAPLA